MRDTGDSLSPNDSPRKLTLDVVKEYVRKGLERAKDLQYKDDAYKGLNASERDKQIINGFIVAINHWNVEAQERGTPHVSIDDLRSQHKPTLTDEQRAWMGGPSQEPTETTVYMMRSDAGPSTSKTDKSEISSLYDLDKTFTTFGELRDYTLNTGMNEWNNRMRINPKLDDYEYKMGAYYEDIEIQVRDAVIDLNNKGYITTDSGFGLTGDIPWKAQAIQGPFQLETSTKASLKNVDVSVDEYQSSNNETLTVISFQAKLPNLGKIQEQWKKVTSLIPKIGDMGMNL